MMRRFYSLFIVVTILIITPALVHAQYLISSGSVLEFNILGGGARAAGMGGAYLGLSEGEYSYSWNPAGMISADDVKLGVQLTSFSDKLKSSDASVSFIHNEVVIQAQEVKREHFSLNFGGFVAPFEFMEREWAIGGGYRNVFDMISEYEVRGFDSTKNTYTQDRGVDAVSAAIAGKIIEGISLGVTANTYLRNSESNYYAGADALFMDQSGNISVLDTWVNINTHYSGFNFDIGVFGDFGIIKGGGVIHTPFDLREEAKRSRYYFVPPVPIGEVDRVTLKYNMPFSYSIGIAAMPVEDLTLAIDFDSRPMSKVDVKVDWEQVLYPDTVLDPEWEDVNQFRIGAEYIMDAGFADVPVRAGFRNEPSTTKELTSRTWNTADGTWTNERGDQISTNILAFGTGIHFERIWFDLAYQFGSSSYNRTEEYLAPQTFEIKRDYSRLFISAGMYF
jgi:hypothetical protein